jgi:cardiolipin synthase A/B
MHIHSPPKQTNRLLASLNLLSSSLVRFVRLGCGVMLCLQVIISAVLLIIAALRSRKMHERSFPHMQFDEVQMDENRLKLYCYGRDLYEDMLAAIDHAQESVCLETYIWKDDEAGRKFKEHLTQKAEQGVDVYVIFDHFGNLVVPRSCKSFHPRIHVLEYQAVSKFWHLFDPRRYSLDHRKILVVDGQISFIGGYNIGSVYEDTWRDTHLRICGPASAELAQSFTDFWNRFHPDGKNQRIIRHYPRKFDPFIVLHGNDAQRLTFPIRDMYIEAINKAESAILLSNAYFIPNHILLGALKAAARRGVEVQILVPWHSNQILADWISHSYYSECLEAGIHVLGYCHTMLHAKTCTIDGQWSTIGTANLDRLSSLGNYELNVEIYSAEFAHQMALLFACDTANRFELTLEHWSHRSWYTKLSERILKPLRFVM